MVLKLERYVVIIIQWGTPLPAISLLLERPVK